MKKETFSTYAGHRLVDSMFDGDDSATTGTNSPEYNKVYDAFLNSSLFDTISDASFAGEDVSEYASSVYDFIDDIVGDTVDEETIDSWTDALIDVAADDSDNDSDDDSDDDDE